MPVSVVTPLPLATVPNVELMHTGTWALASGMSTFTVEDLASAVAALDCPAVRRPILKFGHTPNPAPGQPAIGFIGNLATAENGRTLVGDYVGMPGWLATQDAAGNSVLSSAYPDRSIEAEWNFRCQLGHTHPFVVTAVALLGSERPGIGTLQSLTDLADLYGVTAQSSTTGTPVAIAIHAEQEYRVPNPRAAQVAAGVTTEDVRRAYYASTAGSSWGTWIEEMQLDPLQLIVMDDDSGDRSRVAVIIGAGDGEDAVTFGEPVKVVLRYDDAPATVAAGTAIRYASRNESRPGTNPRKAPTVEASGRPEKGAGMDPAKIREVLGLTSDASDDQVKAALVTAGFAGVAPPAPPPMVVQASLFDPPADPPKPAVTPTRDAAGTMRVDASAWEAAQDRIKKLEAQAAKQREAERDQIIASAVHEGKFAPARREHWVRLWNADPEGAREAIAGLAKNVIPVTASGYAGDDTEDIDAEYAHLFPPTATSNKGA